MKYFLTSVFFWPVFTYAYQVSLGESSEETNNTTVDTKDCGSISKNCSKVILSEGDYLYVSKDKLFVRPLSQTIDDSSYVNSNDTVAVCECLFYEPEASEYGSGSCNLTIEDCPKVSLDPSDVLRLSDSAVFVKSLSSRLDDSAYEVINGSVFICECMIMNQEAEVLNNTCNFSIGEVATISTNCTTVTLKPKDYHILSNSTLVVFAWNVSLNDSFYSVINGLMTVCTPNCDGAIDLGLQQLWTVLFVCMFESLLSWFYIFAPTVEFNKLKCHVVAFFNVMSSCYPIIHFCIFPLEHFNFWVLGSSQISFFVVVGFGMIAISSAYPVIKFLQWAGVVEVSRRGVLPKKRIFMLLFYHCCLILPFVIAYYSHRRPLPIHSFATVSVSDYYYTRKFRDYIPMFYMYDVVCAFYVLICILVLLTILLSNINDQQLNLLNTIHMIYAVLFVIVSFFWFIGYSILISIADEKHEMLWYAFLVFNLILSIFISSSLCHRYDKMLQFFMPYM